MTPEHAATQLDMRLRKFPWYLSIGVGHRANGPVLFVDYRSANHRELKSLGRDWMGFELLVRPVGSIKVCGR